MKRSVLLLFLLAPISTHAQSRPEILVLGTYHMANPGRDIHNIQVDDVMSAKRQAEMTQLIEVLKKFRPTKIALESNVSNGRVKREYVDYLAGKYTLTRNEIDQIGYRLAKELGHKAVYAVDEDGDFPWQRVVNYAKANGVAARFDSINAGIGVRVKAQGDYIAAHTVLENLVYTNSDARAAKDMSMYFELARYGDPYDYAGPDLLAAWYQRNIRIYHNIVKLIESPNERILVIYGSGHLPWLREDVGADQEVTLRKLSDLVAK